MTLVTLLALAIGSLLAAPSVWAQSPDTPRRGGVLLAAIGAPRSFVNARGLGDALKERRHAGLTSAPEDAGWGARSQAPRRPSARRG